MNSDSAVMVPPVNARRNWPGIVWIVGLHIGALFAPFTFTWSGLVVFGILYVIAGMGITVGYHRLLTHRSFHVSRPLEYLFTMCGLMANEGGPIRWVSNHRRHHTHSDEPGDPHSPKNGFWWSHMRWWSYDDEVADGPVENLHNVKDLVRDPVQRGFQRYHYMIPISAAFLVYFGGEWWSGSGVSWLVWGMFLRTVLVMHSTWFVNSAAHVWGYKNFETKDDSRNLWWVAALTFGEGWHNNHHAHQRSARHGLRWWEVDVSYGFIRMLSFFGLANHIHVAPTPKAKEGSRRSVWRVLRPHRNSSLRKVG
jgi:stearoyl-CoA desaturase (delta-9 desaturase)